MIDKDKRKNISRFIVLYLVTYITVCSFFPFKVYAGYTYNTANFYSVTYQTLKKMGVRIDDYFLYDNCWWFCTYYPLTDHDSDQLSHDVKTFLVWSMTEHYFYYNTSVENYYYDDKWNDDYCVIDDIDSDAFRDAINRGLHGRPVSNNTVSPNQAVETSSVTGSHLKFEIDQEYGATYFNLYQYKNSSWKCLARLFASINDSQFLLWNSGNSRYFDYAACINQYNSGSNVNSSVYLVYKDNLNTVYSADGANLAIYNFSGQSLCVNNGLADIIGVDGVYLCNSTNYNNLTSNSIISCQVNKPNYSQYIHYNVLDARKYSSGSTFTYTHYDTYNSESYGYNYNYIFYPQMSDYRYYIIFGDALFYDIDHSYYYHNGKLYDLGNIDTPLGFIFNDPDNPTEEPDMTFYEFVSIENTVNEVINNYNTTIINNPSGNSASYDDTELLAILRSINNKIEKLSDYIFKNLGSGVTNIDDSINIAIENSFNAFFVLNNDQKDQINDKIAEITEPFNWCFNIYDGFGGFLNDIKRHSAAYSTSQGFGSYDDVTLPNFGLSTSGNNASINSDHSNYDPVPIAENDDVSGHGGGARLPSAPKLTVNFGNANSDINYGGEAVILDLDWYVDYKPTGDKIIIALCWACFAWKLIHVLPALVRGESAIVKGL